MELVGVTSARAKLGRNTVAPPTEKNANRLRMKFSIEKYA